MSHDGCDCHLTDLQMAVFCHHVNRLNIPARQFHLHFNVLYVELDSLPMAAIKCPTQRRRALFLLTVQHVEEVKSTGA